MARMRKYGESKTTRIMMATVPQVTSGLGLRKFQTDGFLLTRVYNYSVSFRILKFCVLNLLLGLYTQKNKLVIHFGLQRWYVQYMAGMVWGVGEF